MFAVDLKNEPFGVATWGDDHPATDWNKAAVDIAKHLLKKHDDWTGLVFVEGASWGREESGAGKGGASGVAHRVGGEMDREGFLLFSCGLSSVDLVG